MSSQRGQGHRASTAMGLTWVGHFSVAVAMAAVMFLAKELWRHLDRCRMRVTEALVHAEMVVAEAPARELLKTPAMRLCLTRSRPRGTSRLWAMAVAEVQAASTSVPGIEPTRAPAQQM